MNKFSKYVINCWSSLLKIQYGVVGLGLMMSLSCHPLFGQAEKSVPRIALTSLQMNGDSVLLEASVKVKREGSWQPVDFEPVLFEVRNDSVTVPLGKALTSDKGVASLTVNVKRLVAGEDGSWTFGSVFEGNAIANEGKAELTIRNVGIALTGEEVDTVNSLTLRLFAPGPDKVPLAETDVVFYVKRHFSNLKIGEGTTDENGEVTIECPRDLPGDINGNLILIGRADDLEEYGSVAAIIEKPWGVALPEAEHKKERALWSHSPPLWMIIVFAILMTTVWGHYLVIIYKLIKIRNPKTL